MFDGKCRASVVAYAKINPQIRNPTYVPVFRFRKLAHIEGY